jgi:2-aminoadipate transaminase
MDRNGLPQQEGEPLPLAARMTGLRSSAIRDLLKVTEQPGMISLAGGLPAPDAFPVAELREITERLMRDRPTALLQYSTTEGSPELRAWVARQAAARRDRPVDPGQVLVTHGSQQALDLVAKVFIEPGDVVAIDEPGYVGAIQALSVFQPRFLPIPVDASGINVDILAEHLAAGERPRLVYTVVNFQNPTGATLALDRRRRLAELAEQYRFLIVEDDPYWALRFAGEHLPSIATWSDHVLSFGTFSKLVVPGLRVGYVVAPSWVREHLAKVKQGADLHTSSWGQVVLAELVADEGWLAAHIADLVKVYGTKAVALIDALGRHLGERFAFNRPDGGMFLWGRLAASVAARDLLTAAVDQGVAFVPGDAFYTGPADEQSLRLSFATATPDELDEGARRLAAALDVVSGRG